MIQWLRLWASTAGAVGSIPGGRGSTYLEVQPKNKMKNNDCKKKKNNNDCKLQGIFKKRLCEAPLALLREFESCLDQNRVCLSRPRAFLGWGLR